MSQTNKGKRVSWQLLLALVAMAFGLLVLLTTGWGRAESRRDLHFTILHTNDLHAHDQSFVERGRTVGGMARIAHLIRAIKRQDPQTMVIDAGDMFQGTPFYKFYKGEVEVQMLNLAGYDLACIGNHEFDDGPANLADKLKMAKFPVISANLDATAVPALDRLVKPSMIREIDGQRVGFVGALTPDLNEVSLAAAPAAIKGVPLSDPHSTGPGAQPAQQQGPVGWIRPVAAEVKRLSDLGINKIVLVTHCGVELDRQLAEHIPQADVIVGGHSHTRLDKPIVVQHPDGNCSIIVQTGAYGRTLGKLDLSFDKEGKIVLRRCNYRLIAITEKIPEESDVVAYLASKSEPIIALRKKIVGLSAGTFSNRFFQQPCDSALGNLVCDALLQAGTAYGATIAMQNRGGLRGSIEPGRVTLEKVEEILPFDNKIVFATVKGSAIRRALEHSVDTQHFGGKFLDVSGLKFAYDQSAPRGHRLQFVLTRSHDGHWSELDNGASYKIAMNDYSFSGGEGYDFSGATEVKHTNRRLADAFASFVSGRSSISPTVGERIASVRHGLVELGIRQGQPVVRLRGLPPGSRITMLVGTAPGVEMAHGRLPVPLANAVVVDTKTVGKSGVHVWRVPSSSTVAPRRHASLAGSSLLSSVPAKRATTARNADWVSIVAEPPRRSGGPLVITSPARISEYIASPRIKSAAPPASSAISPPAPTDR